MTRTITARRSAVVLLLVQGCNPDAIITAPEGGVASDQHSDSTTYRDTIAFERGVTKGGSFLLSDDTYITSKDTLRRGRLAEACKDPIKGPLLKWAKPYKLKPTLEDPDNPWPLYEIHLADADVRGTIFVEINHLFYDPPRLIVRHSTSVADPDRFDAIRKNVQERYDLDELADMIADHIADCARGRLRRG